MRTTLLGGVFSLVAASSLWAAAPPPVVPMGNETQDVLFLSSARPVLLRLRVTVDGRAGDARWQAFLARLSHPLDRDGNGSLDREEAARSPSVATLQRWMSGSINVPGPAGPTL